MATSKKRTVVVVTGGDPPLSTTLAMLPEPVAVVAADVGLDYALALGMRVDLVVGDLDSVHPGVLDVAVRAGTEVERHPRAKDASDLELALAAAARWEPDEVIVVGGHGGRLDHLLANAVVLGGAATRGCTVRAYLGLASVQIARPDQPVVVEGHTGEIVTLLSLHGDAHDVHTEGLRYPLVGEALTAGSARGLSNELCGPRARVTVGAGTLLVIRPGVLDVAGSPAADALGDQPIHQPRGEFHER